MEDYYKVLGLKRGASIKEISAAYRSLALIYHPDKSKNKKTSEDDDEKFFQIKAAYQALQDPKVRAELDLNLVGQEERVKRDAAMSAQRKQMKDDLLDREREALNPKKKRERPDTVSVSKSSISLSIDNEDACLLLKCKLPAGLEQSLALEMIKSSLNFGETPVKRIQQTKNSILVEFKDPQAAYMALCRLPNDLIVKADWYTGHPPDNLNVKLEINKTKTTRTENNDSASVSASAGDSVKYSKELEESVLERLKRKKLEKQKE